MVAFHVAVSSWLLGLLFVCSTLIKAGTNEKHCALRQGALNWLQNGTIIDLNIKTSGREKMTVECMYTPHVFFCHIIVCFLLESEIATHSSILAWRIPGTEEPGGLPSMGSHRIGHD